MSSLPMSTHRCRRLGRRVILAIAWAWLAAMTPVATAHADCSGAGDFGAAAGCAPPGDTSGGTGGESWPPTAVDWPPSQSEGAASGGGTGGGAASAPIVVPDGQRAPSTIHAAPPTETSTPTTPIVPVGPATATSKITVIVPAAAAGG